MKLPILVTLALAHAATTLSAAGVVFRKQTLTREFVAEGYLRDVLTRLPAMTTQDDLTALTPARWTPAS